MSCFNSIMVRLKVSVLNIRSLCVILFQFHNGTIKRHILHWLWQRFCCFNSIMVRLKDSCKPRDKNVVPMFQFHNGTIKSEPLTFHPFGFFKFQFHNGTIKSLSPWFLNGYVSCFNSIMVRLKVPAALPAALAAIVSIP